MAVTVVMVVVVLLVKVVVPAEGREVCLPNLTSFLQAYIGHYQYREVHVIFNGTADAQLVAAGRIYLSRSSDMTLAFINVGEKLDTLFQVTHTGSSPGQASSIPRGTPHQDHVHNHRKPIYLVTLPTAIALYDLRRVNVWELSKHAAWLLVGEDLGALASAPFLPLDNQVTMGVWGRGEGVELWEAYQASPTLPQRVFKVGQWQSPTPLVYNDACLPTNGSNTTAETNEKDDQYDTFFPTENYVSRRKNLTGLYLRCVTESWMPFTDNTPADRPGYVNIGGYMGEMFSLLKETLDFTYDCKPSPDGHFGSFENGRWTGVIGEVVEDRADVVVTALDKTYQRSKIIDYCYPYGDIEYHMLIRTPEPHMWDKFTRQLEVKSWLAYLIFLLVVPFIYYLLAAHSPLLVPVSLQEAWFTVCSLTLNQGNMEVSGHARRLLQISVVATSWLMIAFYTSVLVSSLAVPILAPPFTNTAGLLKAGTHTLGLEKGNAEVERLKTSKHPDLQRVWSQLVAPYPNNLVPNIDEGIRKVQEENFVFLTEKHYYSYNLMENCDLYPLPETVFKSSAAVALQKDSPLLLVFSHEIFAQHVAGLVDRSKTHFSPTPTLCSLESTGPINIRTLSTAFLVLAGVLPIALLILLLEIVHYRHYSRPSRAQSMAKRNKDSSYRFGSGEKSLKFPGEREEKREGQMGGETWRESGMYVYFR